MLAKIRPRLSYANVMATLAFFVAIGGGAYAAFQLPKNSVRSKNIVNHQVKGADLARSGPVKSAGLATLSQTQSCGGPGAPQDQWAQRTPASYGPVGYSRNVHGFVHLHGWAAKCGSPPSGNLIFTLPKGYRPAVDEIQPAAQTNGGSIGVASDGRVVLSSGTTLPVLDGIDFQCAPSGANGCP